MLFSVCMVVGRVGVGMVGVLVVDFVVMCVVSVFCGVCVCIGVKLVVSIYVRVRLICKDFIWVFRGWLCWLI